MNPKRAILFAIMCTIFTSIGQVLWKFGILKIDFGNWLTIINIPFLLGFVSYGLGAVLMLLAFKHGELSFVYPIIAISYVWVILLSMYLLPNEFMNAWKWSGVALIIISVSLLGYGNSRKEEIIPPQIPPQHLSGAL